MSELTVLGAAIDGLQPHVVAVALIASRLLPVAFLSPLFGGSQAPTTVKLGVVLALAGSLHVAAGVTVAGVPADSMGLAVAAFKELVLGMTIGVVAALPFDAARMGGRFIDLFRGSSAEAALPFAGNKEAASGDLLFQILVAVVAVGGMGPLVIEPLWRSYAVVPLGTFQNSEAVALEVAKLVGTAFATGLAVGAPIAGLSLVVDLVLGLAARAAPQANLQEFSSPARILAGGAVLWLSLGLLCSRLMAFASTTPESIASVLELGR
jgi:flagellar biosynthesis protein FliR